MNNTEKQTQISISIDTEFNHGDKYDEAMQQIDQTSYYLSALFWLIKTSAKGYDLLDVQTDTKLFEFREFRGNVELVCEIGEALANQLTAYSVKFHDFKESRKINAEPQAAAENNVLDLSNSSAEDLAKGLSDLMKNPNLPTNVYNCLADEFAQTDVDTNSPENILKNLKKAVNDD